MGSFKRKKKGEYDKNLFFFDWLIGCVKATKWQEIFYLVLTDSFFLDPVILNP